MDETAVMGRAQRDATTSRYGTAASPPVVVAHGWTLRRVLPPTQLVSANGMAFGPDGDLYVVEAFGHEVAAVDVDTRAVRNVVRADQGLIGPDDLAFDADGVMYVTEVMSGRVSAHRPDGTIAVVDDDMPAANGIATHGTRLFANEFRPEGRLFELYPDGRTRRLIADGLDWANGMAVGPDERLYYPAVMAGEIWRVPLDGDGAETPERVVDGLALPAAVKFGPDGRLFTAQSAGEVIAIDLETRAATVVARLSEGVDNLVFGPDGRLFVSNNVDGSITEVLSGGALRLVVPPGPLGPLGLDVGPDDTLHIADHLSFIVRDREGAFSRPTSIMVPGFPGVVRTVACGLDGTLCCATTAGGIALHGRRPGEQARFLATGLRDVMGLAVRPGGGVVAAESGAGRVVEVAPDGTAVTLAAGLARPTGVAADRDGVCFVAEADAGRVVRLDGDACVPVVEGLHEPHGIATSGTSLFVADRGAKSLLRVQLASGERAVVAEQLPVGGGPGVEIPVAPGLPPLAPGPLLPFTDVAVDRDGTVYVSADGEGSVLAFSKR